ncbi:MAG: tetratricopeptide repeat protein [Bacteroidetes bacterium]|nr:MAG: tetratricopeptide repeat protein [Bacteroidota bacterium]
MKKILSILFFLIAGALLTEGFQCASPELTTAKLAIKNKEYKKAETNLEVAVSKNPKDKESWVLLAQTKEELGKYEEEANIIKQAMKNIDDKETRSQLNDMDRRLWVNCYQKSIDEYNKYNSDKNKKDFDSAMYLLDVAISIRPEKAELTRIKGQMYESVSDTNQTVKYYNEYINLIDKEINIAKEKQIVLNMSRDDLIKALGKPERTRSIRYAPMTDSVINDYFNIDGKELIVTSIEKNKGLFNVDGWTYNPPANWFENDKTDLNIISIGPFAELAQIFFQRKDYKKAISYVLGLLTINPDNVDANTFLIMVYKSQGGVDEAMKSSAELVKTNPNNKYYRLQYGQILFEAQKYNDAIEQFEKAVQIDQNFAPAVRNLAAAYKNKAVMMQREQQDAADKDPKYKKKPELYIPFLDKSAAFFMRAKQFKEYSKDFVILSELVNIYNVTEKKADCQRILDELEKLEPEIPVDQKYDYYLKLVKIYGEMKMSEKMNRAREEAEKYIPNEK